MLHAFRHPVRAFGLDESLEGWSVMPRSTEEIRAHADELARRFEEHEPDDDGLDARALRDIASAVTRLAANQQEMGTAVSVARAEGHSWAAIGAMLGTSGEAARQRYGTGGKKRSSRLRRRLAACAALAIPTLPTSASARDRATVGMTPAQAGAWTASAR